MRINLPETSALLSSGLSPVSLESRKTSASSLWIWSASRRASRRGHTSLGDDLHEKNGLPLTRKIKHPRQIAFDFLCVDANVGHTHREQRLSRP